MVGFRMLFIVHSCCCCQETLSLTNTCVVEITGLVWVLKLIVALLSLNNNLFINVPSNHFILHYINVSTNLSTSISLDYCRYQYNNLNTSINFALNLKFSLKIFCIWSFLWRHFAFAVFFGELYMHLYFLWIY